MKLTYKTKTHPGYYANGSDLVRRDIHNIDYCCDAIRDHFNGLIDFTGYAADGPSVALADKSVRGWDGDYETEYYTIRFCPFCGAKVEVIEGPRFRLVQKVVETPRHIQVIDRKVTYEEIPE